MCTVKFTNFVTSPKQQTDEIRIKVKVGLEMEDKEKENDLDGIGTRDRDERIVPFKGKEKLMLTDKQIMINYRKNG